MSNVLLTVMIPTTFDRRETFDKIVSELINQMAELRLCLNDDIEIISIEDDREISVGKKRQQLLEMAKGLFVVGIDSDDFIHEDYIQDIVYAIRMHGETIDHIGFIEYCDIDGIKSKSIFSIKHKSWDEQEFGYDQVRCANPKSVIRRTKALQIGYEDLRFGEDRIFSEKITPLLESEIFIEKPLYFYRHNSKENSDRYGFNRTA